MYCYLRHNKLQRSSTGAAFLSFNIEARGKEYQSCQSGEQGLWLKKALHQFSSKLATGRTSKREQAVFPGSRLLLYGIWDW